MITLDDYRSVAQEYGYSEELTYVAANLPELGKFLDFNMLTLDVKVHLAKVVICRHFEATGGVVLTDDVNWFIDGMRGEFREHLIQPWLTSAVDTAFKLIINHDNLGEVVVGTTFMFGVVEHYAKYRLGYRAEGPTSSTRADIERFRTMTIESAFGRLRKQTYPIALDISFIDKYHISDLKEAGIKESDRVHARMERRLAIARNSMVHGESHNHYHMGLYTMMIYALFHYHGLRDGVKYEGI